LASGSSGCTSPVGCTWTLFMSTVPAPAASAILIPSPVQCSPLVVGNLPRSGRTRIRIPFGSKSAANPPVAMITGPCASCCAPPFSYTTPTTAPDASLSSRVTRALHTMLATSPLLCSMIASSFSISAYVMVNPGNRAGPRCVRSCEWPPSRDTRLKSSPKLSTSQSTAGPESWHSTCASGGVHSGASVNPLLCPIAPFIVSDSNSSAES